ncbi:MULTISPECIES: catalase family protein [unclassified Streptomyces]|uniref:catalase family protein n=1 Tax=unclassified Streptomyces TaxID=2593676 RepID=UPI001BE67E10|nr:MULTISPECIES: catalase family protein [unclassified Streptomyces]MBT2407516.1 catalase family protein [Streptomyces sp. ISL-21]MBT2459903.1 catalase family protein [Streptomyces sp. ISL-86]MBT2608145.1 catalase family protein [Streptomyces sp. ISL-87]
MTGARRLNDAILVCVHLERRLDPYIRPLFDRLFLGPVQALVQWLINVRRRDEHLRLAEETVLPEEAEIAEAVARQMARFIEREYAPGSAQRAGNTKTYGVVRGEFTVPDGLPERLRHGVFSRPATFPAHVRFAGPGPLSPPDIKDNGVLSIGVKLLGVEGEKLLDDERATQDFTGISAPTFTTPDVVANLDLQRHVFDGTPVLYFLNLRHPHLCDMVMQGLYAKTHSSPLEARYWSCTPFLLGAGQAMQYSVVPRDKARGRAPWNPPDDYLRDALATTLRERDVFFDFLVQPQTDPHRMPIENASVVWPERLSPFIPMATLRLPRQEFDETEQFALADRLSFNPWHALPEHRPLGNQNRARRAVYLRLSRLRQTMNSTPHEEPGAGM